MIAAIDANHERVMGNRPEREIVTWCSDASVLSRYGIETVNYGPSSGPRDAEGEKVRINGFPPSSKALHRRKLRGGQRVILVISTKRLDANLFSFRIARPAGRSIVHVSMP